jgi:hypothetical protein
LDDGLVQKLNDMGATVTNHAEIIVMDKVEGVDIATIMYRAFLKQEIQKDPTLQYLGNADEMRFHDLHQIVSDKFFYQLNTPTQGVEKMFQDERKIAQQNAEMLTQKLGKSQFLFDENHLESIEVSLSLLRQSGIVLRDAHERNFMIGDDDNVYLIDFGETIMQSQKVTDNDFEGFRMDKSVVMNLRKINALSREEAKKVIENPNSWQDREAGFVNVHIMSKRRGFEQKNGTAFGLTKSKEKIDPRIVQMETMLDEFIGGVAQSKEYDTETLCRELIRNKIKPKREDIPNNTLLNIRALLGGVLYKAYEAYRQDRISLEDCGEIYSNLKSQKLFSLANDSSLGIMIGELQNPSGLMAKFKEFRNHETYEKKEA